MAQYPAVIDISTLNGTDGFRIDGDVYDGYAHHAGIIGDINGDGWPDLAIGAPLTWAPEPGSGLVYVVFGRPTGFPAVINLADIDGTNGFRIPGGAKYTYFGEVATSAGDLNGDGFEDMLVSSYWAVDGSLDGAAWIVFGRTSGFDPVFDITSLDGTNGVRLISQVSFGYTGEYATALGDFNGDGIDDIALGGSGLPVETSYGISYVVFGQTSGWPADMGLNDLDGTNGFRMNGLDPYDAAAVVAAAGDVNGDGFNDLLVGAGNATSHGQRYAGRAYLVFGAASGFDPVIALNDVGTVGGAAGAQFQGDAFRDYAGRSVAGLGDINGDGYDDIAIGASGADSNGVNSGTAYIVFGGPSGPTDDLKALNGANGFRIIGGPGQQVGGAGAAGDVNGDGFDDIMVRSGGSSFVLFGKASGFAATVNSSALGAAGTGFQVLGGFHAGSRDINLDGLDDMLFVEPSGGANGTGATYVVYARQPDTSVTRTGTAADQSLAGGAFHDTLSGLGGEDRLFGNGGADYLYGGDGDDVINGGTENDYMDGGTGADRMAGGSGNDVFYIDDAGDTVIEALGQGSDIIRSFISISALAANVETLQLQGIADLNGTGNGLANNLQGNSGANRLEGGAGVDTINGNDGADIIVGGVGSDLLRGGAGADRFSLTQASLAGPIETDTVYDFSTAQGDLLDLSAVDADEAAAGDQAFHLVGAFTHHAGEMTLAFAGATTTLRVDTDGDGLYDYQMKINGDVRLDSGGWAL
jgi:hypothetical protein